MMLEVKLNNTWLDGRKLKVNITKFKRKVINLQGKLASGNKLAGGTYRVRGKEGKVEVASSGP